ncbi:MAG: amino acid adenylation domain-containing protein, partial [Bacteroidetes bacterium]|nr:amino acid adenylation domain-containing protein [Bacteroidota bacterium]
LIAKYTNNDSAHIAYPIGIREASDFIYGSQINTAILPVRLSNDITLETLIEQSNLHIKSYKINLECRYSHLPIDKIVSGSEIKSLNVGMAQTNLKDTLFNFNNCRADNNKRYNIDIAGAELLLEYEESNSNFNFRIRYQSQLFSEALIKQISRHYQNLLLEAIEKPGTKLSEFSLLTETEYQQIIIDWNKTGASTGPATWYPEVKTIYQLFEEQVLKTPDNIAVVFPSTGAAQDRQLTYAELNAKANQLARYLQSQTTIKPDTLIAICLDRCLEMIIGILGIMKAGGAYVPIDPEYPAERISYILDDTVTALVLTRSRFVERLQGITIINLIELDSNCYQDRESTPLPIQNKPTDLAYVMYTSGTTGKPKGVMNSHGNIISLVINDFIKVTDKDSFAFLSSPVFDASVFEIWMSLCYGAKLVIPADTKELVATANNFISFLDKNSINIIWLTKTLFNTIFSNNQSVFKNIKYLLIGGEALDVDIINSLIATEDKPQNILNGYGPTESTTFATTYLIADIIKSSSVPIGKGINNRFLYVLDKNLCPVPESVTGELHIGGAGLAGGYLNIPELTAQKFISNPFATTEDIAKGYTKIYKTGDLVRWLPDGNLEFIGRNDFQVKIRGYRIELGEIENALTSIENINQACVLAKEKNGNKYLVGYFVSDSELAEENVINQLSEQLPDYMIPGALVKMDNFPLTINGKLDRKVLPDPEFTNEDSYLAPTTDIEIKLCN